MAIATVTKRGSQYLVTYDDGSHPQRFAADNPVIVAYFNEGGVADTTPSNATEDVKRSQQVRIGSKLRSEIEKIRPWVTETIHTRQFAEARHILANPGTAASSPETYVHAHHHATARSLNVTDIADEWIAREAEYDVLLLPLLDAYQIAIDTVDAMPDDLTEANHDAIRAIRLIVP